MLTDNNIRSIAIAEVQQEIRKRTPETYPPFTTENATPLNAITIELDDYTSGWLEIELIAQVDDGTAKYTSKKIVGLFKESALTIDTPDSLHDQNGIAGASWDVIDDSDNPVIQLTGVAATNIIWVVRVTKFLNTITVAGP